MTRASSSAILLLLTITACSTGPRTPQQECEAAAYNDPEVKALIVRSTTTTDNADYLLQDKNDAVKRATLKCLADKGIIRPGGVQPVERPR